MNLPTPALPELIAALLVEIVATICVFRPKPATDSGPFRPPIPEQAGH
ncbi:MAG: hypothetical protein ACT4O1_15460 [Gemmatimonadota bacterium]